MSKAPFPQMKKLDSESPQSNDVITQMKQAAAGASSGFTTRFLTQPFDVLKIRFQLQVEPVQKTHHMPMKGIQQATSKYTSLLQAAYVITKEEGVYALWKGHNAGQVMTITYSLFQFWSYEQFDLYLRRYEYFKDSKNLRKFISGGLAGSVGTLACMPFDVVRTRVIGQDPFRKSTSVFKLVPTILKNEGIHGIFRGMGTSMIQIGPLIGFNFMFYHQLNDIYMNIIGSQKKTPPIIWTLVNGCIAGVISKIAVYPLDFIKRRLQLQGFQELRQTFGRNQKCSSIRHCVHLTLKEEGLLGFYKGMYPALCKSGMTTALYFSFYDLFKKLWRTEDGSN